MLTLTPQNISSVNNHQDINPNFYCQWGGYRVGSFPTKVFLTLEDHATVVFCNEFVFLFKINSQNYELVGEECSMIQFYIKENLHELQCPTVPCELNCSFVLKNLHKKFITTWMLVLSIARYSSPLLQNDMTVASG